MLGSVVGLAVVGTFVEDCW